MDEALKELTRLKGIGPVLGRRFLDAGLDGFEKIVEAGEEGLKDIRGLNPRIISSLLSQIAGMTAAEEVTRERALQEMQRRIDCLAGALRDMASQVKNRFEADSIGAEGKKIEKEIFRILALLDTATARLGKKRKRTAKALERAEKRLLSLDGAGLDEIRKGLRKARKSMKRVLA